MGSCGALLDPIFFLAALVREQITENGGKQIHTKNCLVTNRGIEQRRSNKLVLNRLRVLHPLFDLLTAGHNSFSPLQVVYFSRCVWNHSSQAYFVDCCGRMALWGSQCLATYFSWRTINWSWVFKITRKIHRCHFCPRSSTSLCSPGAAGAWGLLPFRVQTVELKEGNLDFLNLLFTCFVERPCWGRCKQLHAFQRHQRLAPIKLMNSVTAWQIVAGCDRCRLRSLGSGEILREARA